MAAKSLMEILCFAGLVASNVWFSWYALVNVYIATENHHLE